MHHDDPTLRRVRDAREVAGGGRAIWGAFILPLEDIFPRLRGSGYLIDSPQDPAYNCIAHAAADKNSRWWPDVAGEDTWPEGVPREETREAFVAAFATLGYTVCAGEEREPGFEKVALFADAQGVPTHAARQLESTSWTSKLGGLEDIRHALHDREGTTYGSVLLILKRSILTEKIARRGYHLSAEYEVDPMELLFVHEVMNPDFSLADDTLANLEQPGAIVAHPDEPLRGFVLNYSSGGLGLLVEDALEIDTVVRVRPESPLAAGSWVPVRVVYCYAEKVRWRVGCQFLNKMSWGELRMFA